MSNDGLDTAAFNPQRLTLVRKRRGLTKGELAKLIDVDLRSVVAFEAGEYRPAPETMRRMELELHFPAAFYEGDNLDEPDPNGASFRSMSKMRPVQRDMALGQGAIALHLNAWLESKFELPLADLPDLSRERSPEAAAAAIRQIWGIGELPIRNMVHLLEAKGIRVFSLAIDTRHVDAFSWWHGSTPFIFLNNNKSSEHSRYDAAHELGHLLLHRSGAPNGREAEREADAFGGAFLMPTGSVIAHAPKFPTLNDLIRHKRIWTVSVAALNYRFHEVGMLTDWQYRTLCVQIAKRGYRTFEPNEAPRETSQLLTTMFGALSEEGISRAKIARDLRVPQSELEELMFGLTMTRIEGKRKSAPASGNEARLSLVTRQDD